ncbi:unnamed protein product [Adineta steineri]|uniref:diacetyl reductase [(S)-acetoin forming] n=1 Tax=Adineta steineri TaxID=433720 RepID=A0A818TBM1_9BILA|nr:unnamed protein product [Adineta steineri]CAF3647831.1 unnamed protein product [Adineta steineri]CAF3679568.1 unnamed protein product [Adineta steineri]
MSRNVLVTGAARGIGQAIALRLAKDGFNVAVNDIEVMSQELHDTQKTIEKLGRKSISVIADVSNDKQVETMMKKVSIDLGSLDIAVANAGIAQVKPFIELTTEDWDRMFAVNMRGVFLCYKEAAKIMIKQGTGGKIIGACSVSGYKASPLLSHYSATKWGVRGLTQAAAMELAKHKITVNAYCPGIVDTEMWNLIDEKLGKYENKKKGEVIKEYSNKLIALGRTSVPDDVANFVSYLASKDSDYMTGQSILIDGGIEFS